MAEVKTKPVPVTLLPDREVEDCIVGAPAGAIQFFSLHGLNPHSFHFQCPCGCGAVGGVKVAGEGAWQWNGSREKPTVHPSVLLHGNDGPHWHGWLRNGVWESC